MKKIDIIWKFIIMVLLITSCYKAGKDLPDINEIEMMEISQINNAFSSLYNSVDFKASYQKMEEEGVNKNTFANIETGFALAFNAQVNYHLMDIKLKNNLYTSLTEFQNELEQNAKILEDNYEFVKSEIQKVIDAVIKSGMVDVINAHYTEIIKYYPSKNHPMVKAAKYYFVDELKIINEEDFYEILQQDPSLKQEVEQGFLQNLLFIKQGLEEERESFYNFQKQLKENASTYYSSKSISILPPINLSEPTQNITRSTNSLSIIGDFISQFTLKDIFQISVRCWPWDWDCYKKEIRKKATKKFKNILRSIEAGTLIHYNEYFRPNIYAEQTGNLPGYNVDIGGGFTNQQQNSYGVPQEFPITIISTIKGFIQYTNGEWFLFRDGQKLKIHNTDGITEWEKKIIITRNEKVFIEGKFEMIYQKEEINGENGGGYYLSVLKILSIRPSSTGPLIVYFDPQGNEVPYTSPITVIFSQPIDTSTLTSSTFYVKEEDINLPGSISYYEDEQKHLYMAVFTPSVYFISNKKYDVFLDFGIKGKDGTMLANPTYWSFIATNKSNLFDEGIFDEAKFGY